MTDAADATWEPAGQPGMRVLAVDFYLDNGETVELLWPWTVSDDDDD